MPYASCLMPHPLSLTMRWDFWLAQPNTGRRLRALLRATGGLCLVWALAAGGCLWRWGAALAEDRAALNARQKQTTELGEGLRRKRADARQVDALKTPPPDGEG